MNTELFSILLTLCHVCYATVGPPVCLSVCLFTCVSVLVYVFVIMLLSISLFDLCVTITNELLYVLTSDTDSIASRLCN